MSTLFGLQHDYAAALIKEMHMRRSEFNELDYIGNSNAVDTIYIGGGTPSTLPLSDIQEILNTVSECFPGNPREVTIEVNPDDITPEFVDRLRSIGINRISMGIQTFDDSRLQFLHRRHTSSQAIDAVRIIKDAGIENISIDLMFGFPHQTLDEWKSDVQTAISLSPTHISAYSLMYEEGTLLYRMMSEGKITQVAKLTSELNRAVIFDPTTITTAIVSFATVVTLHNNKDDKDETYTVLGPWESDPDNGIISYMAPFGNAIMNAKVGENLKFDINEYSYDYTVKSIKAAKI